jgi:hypothetical protein
MKTLRLSDEDYTALLEALDAAESNADYLRWGTDESSLEEDRRRTHEYEEARRLHDLIKPIEYEHTLESERFHAVAEALSLLGLAGVPVTLTNGEQKVEL